MTIGELVKAGKFTVVHHGGYGNDCKYHFRCTDKNTVLISGDVFGDDEILILNSLEVLYCLAKGNMSFSAKLQGGLSIPFDTPSLELKSK